MGENDTLDKGPKFIEDIEDILHSLVSFLLNFPLTTYRLLINPSNIFVQDVSIKSLTYFSVSLLLTSAFWYSYFLPTESFLSPLFLYLIEPNFDEIKNYFFDKDSLEKALIGLLPIILLTHIGIRIISILFRKQERVNELLQFFFYLMGLILICIPLLFLFFIIIIPKSVFNFFEADIMDSSWYEITDYIVFGVFLIAIIRAIWLGAVRFFEKEKKHWVLKRVLFSALIFCFCGITLKVVSLFYSVKKSTIESSIKQVDLSMFSSDTSNTDSVMLDIVITNKSEIDQPVNLSSFELKAGTKDNYNISLTSTFKQIQSPSEPLSENFILRNHTAIFFKIPFYLSKADCKKLDKYFENHYLPDGSFTLGKIDLILKIPNGNLNYIEEAQFKDKTESDLRKQR